MLSFFYIHHAYVPNCFEVIRGQLFDLSLVWTYFHPCTTYQAKSHQKSLYRVRNFFFPKNFQLWGGFNCTENASQTVHKHYFEDFESLLLRYVNAEWVGGDCEKSQFMYWKERHFIKTNKTYHVNIISSLKQQNAS